MLHKYIYVYMIYYSNILDGAIFGVKACLRHTYCIHEPRVKSFMSYVKHSQHVIAVWQPAALLQEAMEAICKDN